MPADRAGLELSTSPEAADAYVEGVERLLAAWPGAAAALDRAIAEDPDFALAHAARARLEQMAARGAESRASVERAAALARRATRRERQHVEVVALAVEGRAREALTALEQHVDEYPGDALVLSLALGAFGLYAFGGRVDHDRVRLERCQRVAAQQPADDWWFLTYLGWAHTEAGNLDEGYRITRAGFELRRENAHGAHALAHAYHERGEHAAALGHLDDWLAEYPPDGQLFCHLNWHRALLDLEAGDADAALARYRRHMAPARSQSPPINVLTDGASLMWRIMLDNGHAPVLAWPDLVRYAERTWPEPAVAFIDVHCAMAAAGGGDRDAFARRAGGLDALAEVEHAPSARVPAVLSHALEAFVVGDHEAAADAIESVRDEIACLGGSHAQREVFEETLIAACARGGQRARACVLLDERLARRPSVRDTVKAMKLKKVMADE